MIHEGIWSDGDHQSAEHEAQEAVRAAAREAEAVGTLGQSKVSSRTLFEDVFAQPDWRLRRQRQQLGV